MTTALDARWMARAIELAARARTTTHPNPRVGCVIAVGDRLVGEGWHERAGEPHAERNALAMAGAAARGATAYVTLEPCCHHGRTPPCTDALIEAGIARVVYAVPDPNPLVNGGGHGLLQRAGIATEAGLLAGPATMLNRGFFSRLTRQRPFTTLKLAMSLDGRTALADGRSRWITGEAARADVQRQRAEAGAILTGIGTLLADDPRLDVRLPGSTRQPLRVVLDSELRTPPSARLFASPGDTMLVASSALAGNLAVRAAGMAAAVESRTLQDDEGRHQRLRPPVIEFLPASADGHGIALDAVLSRLAELEIGDLWVEAGPTLSGAMIQGGWVDELVLYVAPRWLGAEGRPLALLPPPESLEAAADWEIVATRRVGDDLRLTLRPRAAGAN